MRHLLEKLDQQIHKCLIDKKRRSDLLFLSRSSLYAYTIKLEDILGCFFCMRSFHLKRDLDCVFMVYDINSFNLRFWVKLGSKIEIYD